MTSAADGVLTPSDRPGAASDEVLNISTDGTGRLDVWNWRLCEVIHFTWRTEGAALTVEGQTYFLLDDDERPIEERPWQMWHWTAVPYSVDVLTAPLHPNGVEVLTIDHGTTFVSERFGRVANRVPDDVGKYLRQL